MRTQDWRKPKKEKPAKYDPRLRRESGKGDRTLVSFYQLKTGEDRLSEKEILQESGSLMELERRLNAE